MSNKWLKEESKRQKEHLDYVPEVTNDPKINFEELLILANQFNSRMQITGDHNHFIIQSQNDVKALRIVIPFFLSIFPLIMLLTGNYDPIFWYIELFLVILVLVLPLFYQTYDIEVNTHSRQIIITNNTFIWRFVFPSKYISFDDFKEFIFKLRLKWFNYQLTVYNHRIYISYKDKKQPIIDLWHGPVFFVNHKIFIACLTRIIKQEKSA